MCYLQGRAGCPIPIPYGSRVGYNPPSVTCLFSAIYRICNSVYNDCRGPPCSTNYLFVVIPFISQGPFLNTWWDSFWMMLNPKPWNMVNLGHLALIHTYAKSEADTGTVNYQFQTTAWFHVQTNMAGKYNKNGGFSILLCSFFSGRFIYVSLRTGSKKKNVNPWQVEKSVQVYTLPETKMFAPKNGWLEDEFPCGMAHFQGSFAVSFRECKFWGVPNECFGRFVTGKTRPSDSEAEKSFLSKEQKTTRNLQTRRRFQW